MSTHTSSSESGDSDPLELDPDYKPNRIVEYNPRNIPSTRSQSKNKNINVLDTSLIINDKNPILKPIKIMSPVKLSFETALHLIPIFDGENPQKIYQFLKACDFVIKNIDAETQSMLLEAIQTKLVGNAFTVIQHKEISSWSVLKEILEESYCATRTPGYLQLELSTTRFRQGESVQQYASRVEKLLSELCNVSTSRKSTTEAKIINDYIKEVTLTTFVEGLPNSIRGIIKSRNFRSIEEAMKGSLEEDKIYQSNKEAQRLMQNKPSTSGNSKYCKQCRKNNHNTNECKYANRNMDTGQQNKQSMETKKTDHKRLTCAYCHKPGHLLEDCFKKKNSDARKANNDGQTSSGNDKRTDTAGDRPVRELKVIAQHQKF